MIENQYINDDWWFIGVYANTKDHIREQQWKLI